MLSSFPATSVNSSSISNPSSAVNSTQSPVEYLHFDDQGRSPQFSSSFSIRAILSSSSNSPPPAQSFPSSISYGQLLLTGDVGSFDCSAPFLHHHCCHQGVCAVNWQADKGMCDKIVINTPLSLMSQLITSRVHKNRGMLTTLSVWFPSFSLQLR